MIENIGLQPVLNLNFLNDWNTICSLYYCFFKSPGNMFRNHCDTTKLLEFLAEEKFDSLINNHDEVAAYNDLRSFISKKYKCIILICPEQSKEYIEFGTENKKRKASLTIAIFPNSKAGEKIKSRLASLSIKKDQMTYQSTISILCSGVDGLFTKSMEIKDSSNTSLELNYGKNFREKHAKILEFFKESEKRSSGLLLFHGSAGTGKTTYIRHLANLIKNQVIFIPSYMFGHLAEPKFVNFLSDYKNSVLVLEDAEEILKSREDSNNGTVSNLLNICDGILGDCLKVKVICTFNTHLDNIDSALLRKGRLHFRHEFEKLSIDDSNTLLKSLNSKHIATEPMSLADIYNIDTDNNALEKKDVGPIGFQQ